MRNKFAWQEKFDKTVLKILFSKEQFEYFPKKYCIVTTRFTDNTTQSVGGDRAIKCQSENKGRHVADASLP